MGKSSSPKAILLCGISASGKTRYSRQCEAEGAVRLSVDEQMWRQYGDFTRLPSEQQRRLTLAAEEMLREKMKELLTDGRDVVVDSCLCKRFKREAFEKAAVEAGALVDKVFLFADEEVLRRRLAMRKGSDPNDIKVSDGELDRFLQNFQIPAPDENYRTVDTSI